MYPLFERRLRKFLAFFETKQINAAFQKIIQSQVANSKTYKFSKFFEIRWSSMYNSCTSIYRVIPFITAFLTFPENRLLILKEIKKTKAGRLFLEMKIQIGWIKSMGFYKLQSI